MNNKVLGIFVVIIAVGVGFMFVQGDRGQQDSIDRAIESTRAAAAAAVDAVKEDASEVEEVATEFLNDASEAAGEAMESTGEAIETVVESAAQTVEEVTDSIIDATENSSTVPPDDSAQAQADAVPMIED